MGKKTETIKTVNAQYGYKPEHSLLRVQVGAVFFAPSESFSIFLSTVYPGNLFPNIATHSNGETRNSMAFLALNIITGIVLSALGNLITM